MSLNSLACAQRGADDSPRHPKVAATTTLRRLTHRLEQQDSELIDINWDLRIAEAHIDHLGVAAIVKTKGPRRARQLRAWTARKSLDTRKKAELEQSIEACYRDVISCVATKALGRAIPIEIVVMIQRFVHPGQSVLDEGKEAGASVDGQYRLAKWKAAAATAVINDGAVEDLAHRIKFDREMAIIRASRGRLTSITFMLNEEGPEGMKERVKEFRKRFKSPHGDGK
ncbi:MAG: hypothetical protein Q9207_001687 [Kuettlingeria erythrocarpa]